MEIEITSLLETDCFPLSHSVAEGGDKAALRKAKGEA